MNNIKSLQRGVCNSLRSSVILFDLPRVVEELTCNSVDSGATKVYISINVRACLVKVEDNGCGIMRDGLVILGERFATSKSSLLADTERNSECLGFRGEALASLSDVSLVEIRTKARGMPTAYCKILKGSNCLFLGIDDQREAVGTTVVVRDLFYNQPVRRKYMQSSPRKVLHSIKKCVLRIALVHPQVLFKVTDTASEEELLCTVPASSPLPLVRDGFGDDVSSSLQEVVFSDQLLMLSGYISGATNVFSTKAFQYLYINSRFVCKGPIHNLLNNLAANFQCSSTHLKVEPEFQSRKRHKIQGYPAFLLNLCCPLSSYDLHFEPSKTIVEFKDWNAVLSFFEQTIRQFWDQVTEKPLQGNNNAHNDDVPIGIANVEEEFLFTGLSNSSIMREAECDMQLHRNIPAHSSVINPLDISLDDGIVHHKKGISSEEMRGFSWLKPCQKKGSYLGQPGNSSPRGMHISLDAFRSPHGQLDYVKSNQQWSADVGSSLLENNLFSDQTTRLEDKYSMSDREWRESITEKSKYAGQWSADDAGSSLLQNNLFFDKITRLEDRYCISDGEWMKNIHENSKDSGNLKSGAGHVVPDCDPFNIIDNDEKLCLASSFTSHGGIEKERSHSLGYENGHSVSFRNHNAAGVGFDHLGKFSPFQDSSGTAEEEKVSHTSFEEKDNTHKPVLSAISKCQENHDLDLSDGAKISLSCEEASLYEKIKLPDRPASDFWLTDSICLSPDMDWNPGKPQSLSTKSLKTDAHRCSLREHLPSVTGAGSRFSGLAEVVVMNSVQNSSDDVFPERYSKTVMDYQGDFIPKKKEQYGSPSDYITFGKVGSSALLNDKTCWSPSESSNRTDTKNCSKSAFWTSMQVQDEGSGKLWDKGGHQNSRPSKVHKERSRRSSSAPPFHKGKYKFSTLNDHLTTMADFTSHSPFVSESAHEGRDVNEVPLTLPRNCVDEKMSSCHMDRIQNIDKSIEICCDQSSYDNAAEGSVAQELEYTLATPTRWRTGSAQSIDREVSHTNKDDVLSISSGLLHLSASSLIPESITKDCLENAKVLLQVDRKFIPVMAGEILVIVDQHAADERIRLEELRHKVLSGKGNNITYLDSMQELVLPEMGYQLLQKYTDQIQKWGWICSITESSESFTKNVSLLKRSKCGVTLIAVPCILGINLNGKDLVEFIEQLVETDGSSTIPPSVIRILNFKACRGAIMFGDSLLPSECSLILEELKATSLCFQCAHGRPTTVPLLNVASLHEQLAILEMEKGGPDETWHGLRRYAPSVGRAQQRLESAKRFQGG